MAVASEVPFTYKVTVVPERTAATCVQVFAEIVVAPVAMIDGPFANINLPEALV